MKFRTRRHWDSQPPVDSQPLAGEQLWPARMFSLQRGKRDCRKQGITYNIYCDTFQGEKHLRVKVAAYPGETGRGKEHLNFLEKQSEDNSVLWLHSLNPHQGRLDIQYPMECTGSYRSPLDRQISKKIQICCFHRDILMNRRTDGRALVEREKF